MADYIRKIIYLRKKERGSECSGSGYIRLEKQGSEFRIHLTIPEEPSFGRLPVYAVYEKKKELYPLFLGEIEESTQWDYCQKVETKRMEWYVEDLLGFVIGKKDCYFVGELPEYDKEICYEEIHFKTKEEMRKKTEEPAREENMEIRTEKAWKIEEEVINKVQEDEEEGQWESIVKYEKEEETEEQGGTEKQEEAEEQEEAEKQEEAGGQEKSQQKENPKAEAYLEKLTEMYPFQDDEMEWCYGMEPDDFSFFPMEYWHYAKNTFLLEGFYNYRHLLYAHKEGKNYLGVPGQFHRRDQFLARQFGFPYFKATKKKRTTVGDFGYWMKELN